MAALGVRSALVREVVGRITWPDPSVWQKKEGSLPRTGELFDQEEFLWECAEGHQWEAAFYVINRGSWCWECATEKMRRGRRGDNLRIAQEIAKERGGRCLEKENFW